MPGWRRWSVVGELDEPWRTAFAWLESEMNGPIVRAERQLRWRPAWLLDAQVDGALHPLYWRGDRGLSSATLRALEREAAVLSLVEAHGIPVPHVHAFRREAPAGVVLERCPGSPDVHLLPAAQRKAVGEEFVRVMARWHAIPVDEVAALGFAVPDDAAAEAAASLASWRAAYAGAVSAGAPRSPLVEHAVAWLDAHRPEGEAAPVLVHGDNGSGQFLVDHGRITGVLDWEFAHLGDPMEDLALMRGRAVSYPFGDLNALFRRYAEVSGRALDAERLRYYSVLAMLITPVGLHGVVEGDPERLPPGTDLAQALAWHGVFSSMTAQALAEATGVDAGGGSATPQPERARRSGSRHGSRYAAVARELRVGIGPAGDEWLAFQAESVARVVEHLALAGRIGPSLEADDVADAHRSMPEWRLGAHDRAALDEELVARIDAMDQADSELVGRVTGFLVRRCRRELVVLAPVLGELADRLELAPLEV